MARRQTSEVFPSLKSKGVMSSAEAEDTIGAGASRFVSERTLAQNKQARGTSVDDGSGQSDQSLYDVLQQQKREKDEEREEAERLLKQGTMKPLDEEEAEFVNNAQSRSDKYNQLVSEEEQREIAQFHAARKAASSELPHEQNTTTAHTRSAPILNSDESEPPRLKRPARAQPSSLCARVKTQRASESTRVNESAGAAADAIEAANGISIQQCENADDDGNALASLLSAYGSSDDD